MSHAKKPADNETRETARLEAFSDGVFAIAITLLVLELIQILHPQSGEGLLKFYLHHWEPFLAFLIGFLTVLVCWINHKHVFDYIIKTDSSLPLGKRTGIIDYHIYAVSNRHSCRIFRNRRQICVGHIRI